MTDREITSRITQLLDDMEASLLRCKVLVESASIVKSGMPGGKPELESLTQRLARLEHKVAEMKNRKNGKSVD